METHEFATPSVEPTKPLQFSLASLLVLTTVCALVLSIGTWARSFVHASLVAVLLVLVWVAYRAHGLMFRYCLTGAAAAATLGIAESLVDRFRFPFDPGVGPSLGVVEFLLFAILGSICGMWLAARTDRGKTT